MLVAGVTGASDSVVHTHRYINLLFFRFFSISSYKILSGVACAVTDALVGHLF